MPQYELLNDTDVPLLADAAIAVLEEVGILCQNADLLDALEALGAAVEREIGLGIQLYGKPVEVSRETIALDTIIEVGFGIHKSYLSQDHTLDHFRDDTWIPPFLDRSGYTGPEQEQGVLDRLQQEIDDLIASYRKPEKDPDNLERMRQVVERARSEIGDAS